MISIERPIYRYGKEDELTKKIEQLLNDLEAENEGIVNVVMDMTLDSSERREKTFWETVGNPENYQELLTLQSRSNTLESVISELKSIIYSDYETIPLSEQKKTEPRMGPDACRIWLGTTVKPLILGGETLQQNISDKLKVGASTISTRVKSGYKTDWKTYVEFVEQGIY